MKFTLLALLLLAGAALGVYAPVLNAGFVLWDDRLNIYENPYLLRGEWWAFWLSPYYLLYIPLTYTIWTAIHHLFEQPAAFHVFNVVVHISTGWWVYRLTLALFPHWSKLSSWAVAFVFVLHPLQAESVAWISGGRDVLAAHFAIAATTLLVTNALGWRLWVSLVFFVAAMLCKPSVAFLPLALLALNRAQMTFAQWLTWLAQLSAAAVLLAYSAHHQSVDPSFAIAQLGLGQRLAVGLDTFGFYLAKFVWPWPQSADYGRTPLVALASSSLWAYAGLALVALASRRREIWFTAMVLFPVLGFFTFQAQLNSTVSDRYMYLPLLGLAWATVSCVRGREAWLMPVLAVWSILTFQRAEVFRESRALFSDMLAHTPDSPVGLSSLAALEFFDGRHNEAERYFRRSLEVRPDWAPNLANLALTLWEQKKIAAIEAEIAPLILSKQWRKQHSGERGNLATLYRVMARVRRSQDRFAEASDYYCQAFEWDPGHEAGRLEFEEFLRDVTARYGRVFPCIPDVN